ARCLRSAYLSKAGTRPMKTPVEQVRTEPDREAASNQPGSLAEKSARPKTIRKPTRSFWQIWNMSFGFLGIQFGWALQMANMSAIYEYLGARADQIPMLWLAAPLTGLIVQPIIGH